MTIEEFVEEKRKRLEASIEKIEKDWASRYPDEKPYPPLVSFEDWDNYFYDEF